MPGAMEGNRCETDRVTVVKCDRSSDTTTVPTCFSMTLVPVQAAPTRLLQKEPIEGKIRLQEFNAAVLNAMGAENPKFNLTLPRSAEPICRNPLLLQWRKADWGKGFAQPAQKN